MHLLLELLQTMLQAACMAIDINTNVSNTLVHTFVSFMLVRITAQMLLLHTATSIVAHA